MNEWTKMKKKIKVDIYDERKKEITCEEERKKKERMITQEKKWNTSDKL